MSEHRKRVVLVTGAASGIGAAICRALAGPGVAILVHTRANRAGAEATADAVRAAGGQAKPVLGDLAMPDAAGSLVGDAVRRFGGLDVLVSNAGFADRTALAELTDAAMTRSMEAIHGAFFRLTRAAIPHLIAGRNPRIVAVSSFVAHAFRTDMAVFPASAAAKAASEALVRALAIELAPSGVTVNAVVPGFIRKDAGTHAAFTPAQAAAQVARIPLGRLGLPDDVAAAVAFLVSPGAAYITGQALHVDGGLVIRA
jgi:3-oxoacyl-[acyl-carrier protein] reductase